MRSWPLWLLAACYSPSAKPGAQCSPMGLCPSGLVCAADNTCQLPGTMPMTDAPIDTPVSVIDGPPDAELCTSEICGDGIDQNCDGLDNPCPANDSAQGAIDVSAGGDFTADLTYATSDSSTGGSAACGTNGGRDVFYSINASKSSVWYFDTFGSNFDTVIRVFPGACKNGTATGVVCHNDQCNTTQSQWVGTVAAGDNCVVISQRAASDASSQLMLHVEPGAWNGTLLPGGPNKTTTSTTVGLVDDSSATCGGAGGPDKAYYIVGCPGDTQTLDATSCTGTAFNSVIYVLGPNGTELACNDDDAACSANTGASTVTGVQLNGAHLFWLVIDGVLSTDSGAFTLTTTLQ